MAHNAVNPFGSRIRENSDFFTDLPKSHDFGYDQMLGDKRVNGVKGHSVSSAVETFDREGGTGVRVGILSDTHDQLDRTRRALNLLQDSGVDVLIHCGDFTSPEIVTACCVLPLYFVFGNNDSDSVPLLRWAGEAAGATCLGWGGIVELAGKRIGVTHGHMTTDLRAVLKDSPDYLLSGHSHYASDDMEGAVRRINPGALHRASEFTVATLDLITDQLQFITVPR